MIAVGERIYMRTAERATEIAEGLEPLAVYLCVPPALVAAWIRGTREIPPAAFLRMVEIIIDHGARRAGGAIPPLLVATFKHREAANG